MIWQPRVGQRVRLRYGVARALARARRHAVTVQGVSPPPRATSPDLIERVRVLFPLQDRSGTVVAFGARGRGPRNVLVRLDTANQTAATGSTEGGGEELVMVSRGHWVASEA